jgi:ABC transporter substrate binding protein
MPIAQARYVPESLPQPAGPATPSYVQWAPPPAALAETAQNGQAPSPTSDPTNCLRSMTPSSIYRFGSRRESRFITRFIRGCTLAATYVDGMLKGAKPADLPVQLQTKFGMVINLKTAKALGITIPPSISDRPPG